MVYLEMLRYVEGYSFMYMEGEVNKSAILPKAMRPYFSWFKRDGQGVRSVFFIVAPQEI